MYYNAKNHKINKLFDEYIEKDKINSGIGKGYPYKVLQDENNNSQYYPVNVPQDESNNSQYYPVNEPQDENNIPQFYPINVPIDRDNVPTENYFPIRQPSQITTPDSISMDEQYQRDLIYSNELREEISKIIYPFVIRELDRYEYIGSPIYENDVDRETINQLTDRIIESSARQINQVEEIILEIPEYTSEKWLVYDVFRSLTNSLLLNELYSVRRPRYRRLQNIYPMPQGNFSQNLV